jgi:thymidine phosphorylase
MTDGSNPALQPASQPGLPLRARRLGIHTQNESVVFMRTDCHVCRSEGLSANSRVLL